MKITDDLYREQVETQADHKAENGDDYRFPREDSWREKAVCE